MRRPRAQAQRRASRAASAPAAALSEDSGPRSTARAVDSPLLRQLGCRQGPTR
ncbi:MAG: hypothetical protein ACK56I_03135 [bacterium]